MRFTISGEEKLFRFDKIKVTFFEILLIDVAFNINMFESWYLLR